MRTNDTRTDYELVTKSIAGDTSAFSELVNKHKDVSLSLVCSIIKDEALSEDVLQEVFVKVFKGLKSFEFKASFTTWLYRIVVNTAYNAAKKYKPSVSLTEADSRMLNLKTEDRDQLKEADQRRYINLALKRLRGDEALVLRLFYLCDRSVKEIARITNFKPSKIKVDLHRGRDNLQFQLKQLLGDDIEHLL